MGTSKKDNSFVINIESGRRMWYSAKERESFL